MIYPALALVFLTFAVWLHMYFVRLSEMHRHGIGPEEMTAFNRNLPRRIMTSGDNLRNLFEIPVLFYFATAVIIFSDRADGAFIAMSWAFVLLRYLHSIIHLSYNRIAHRFVVYALSSFVLWAIWFRYGWLLLGQQH